MVRWRGERKAFRCRILRAKAVISVGWGRVPDTSRTPFLAWLFFAGFARFRGLALGWGAGRRRFLVILHDEPAALTVCSSRKVCRDALRESLAARVDVLEELFQTIPAQNMLLQVRSGLLRPGAPQINLPSRLGRIRRQECGHAGVRCCQKKEEAN